MTAPDTKITDEMVEKAAQAIFADTFGGTSDPYLSDYMMAIAMSNARVALEAVYPLIERMAIERAAEHLEAEAAEHEEVAEDDENYRGSGEYDTISDAGRRALQAQETSNEEKA